MNFARGDVLKYCDGPFVTIAVITQLIAGKSTGEVYAKRYECDKLISAEMSPDWQLNHEEWQYDDFIFAMTDETIKELVEL